MNSWAWTSKLNSGGTLSPLKSSELNGQVAPPASQQRPDRDHRRAGVSRAEKGRRKKKNVAEIEAFPMVHGSTVARARVMVKQTWQPDVSNRRLAKALNVDETTVRRDSAANAAPAQEKAGENKLPAPAAAANAAPDKTLG